MAAFVHDDLLKGTPAESIDSAGASISWYALTHVGSCRATNEDSYCVEAEDEGKPGSRHVIAIADGVGGHGHGDIASKRAIMAVKSEFWKWPGGVSDRFLKRAVRRANDEIFSLANDNPLLGGMQTTLTAVALEWDDLAIAHVGDCRLYRIREGACELLTRDHSASNEMARLRLIPGVQADQHPDRYKLARTVGASPFLRADLSTGKVAPGDTFLLCSDGLWSGVALEDIRGIAESCGPDQACRRLVEMALRDPESDNITAIVFRVTNASPSSVSPLRAVWNRVSTAVV